jgi:hypothetical protein
MTTIAATRTMMAADSLVVVGDLSFPSIKLVRFADAIMGAAGDSDACHLFYEWWPQRLTEKFKLPKGLELEVLVLTRDGLYRYGEQGKPDIVSNGMCAVGTGASFALGSLDTQVRYGQEPDPRIAVEMACLRNPNSRPPVQYFTLEHIYEDNALPLLWGPISNDPVESAVQAVSKKRTRRVKR